MRERFTKISILRTVMSIMLLAVALGMAAKVAQAAKNRATTFVLEKIEGDVRIVSSSKEEKSVLEGMQLYRGDHQITGAGSYAWMSLDASKAIKLDENSESALKKAWFSKKLEVYSVKGKLFFNVSVPLAEDEAFNIRTSTMVTGIRGTSGWVEVSDDWKSTIFLLTGELECLVVNPLDNGSQTITLHPGEYAEFFVFPKSEIEGEEASCGVTTKTFTEEDIPGFILEEILGNDELIDKIYKETNKNIDLRNLTPDYVQKRIKADQEKHKKEKQEMEEKASEELTIVEKEPVWKPENIKASKVAYLLMPQTAKTVQKYLNEEKYQKVVLVPGSGSEKDNTLKVDIALTTPAGKTLEAYAGVPVEVLPNYSLTVDGTAHLTKLTNEGTVTVRSANTLEIEELLVNLGVLEITESGRLVLKKTMETSGSFVNSGVVEAAPDATGDEMIRINGGKVVMLSGMISSNRHDTIMRLADGAQAEFQFAGGMIANEMEDGASILAREEDFQVTVLGTDIMGVTNTILGKGAVLEKYNAGSVFRKDERYHLIELDKVDSYPVVVAKVEHGTIIAPSRVEVGAKVTLTAIPDEGYQLEYLSVNNYNSKTKKVGSSVSLSAEQSFIMPSSDVIVGGSFIEIAGEPKYQVTVRRADGGSVRASATEAKAGETIQITVQNGAGHELEGLTVKDEDGNAVGITTSGNGYAFTMPEMNVTVTPSFRTLEYNVVFYDDDKRTVLNQQTLKYGTIPKYEGTKPEKSTDAQYSYTFLGWQIEEETYAEDAILPDVTGNMVFTAVYAKKVVEGPYIPPTTYTVTWRNWDGTELEKDTGLTNGATPSYDSTIPTRDADVNVSYDFAGWTSSFGEYGAAESLPAVTGDITYTARFTSTTRKYTITWLNYNGELLETDELVPYGSMPTYDGETPEKNVEDPQYSYIFAGWDAAIVPVAGNATYKATYTQELNSYTIRFLNEDGSVMETLENVDYGTMPAYTSIPTKTGDDQYSYDFAGWNPELTTVEGDTDYTVVFTQRINKYKVIWLNEGGAPLKTQEGIEYDTIPSYPEASNPTKGTDAQYTYEFAGWKVGTTPYAIGTTLPPVHGDVTFTAYYTPTLRQFDVTFLDEDGTTPIQNTTKFDYGTLATTYAPADPTKTASGQYTYAFAGWTPDNGTTVYTKAQLPMVTDDVVYKATYTTTIHPLSVSLDAQSLDLFVGGTAATLTATITPSDAANQNVLWSSDDESVATVTGNGLTATVTAVANGTATITVKTEDGGYEASCTVTVKTHVTGVSLDQAELTVILGTTETLQATVAPATASNQKLIWTSGDNDIVFVSTVEAASAEDVGKVTVHPVAAGTTTITVTTEDGSFEQSCAVIVKGYTVTFVNDDDAHTQLNQQLNVAKDAIPSFAGAAQPTKTADLHYTYTFAGWQVGETKYPTGTALPAVTGDVTYTAYYNNVVIPYNVTFVDEDGTTPLKVATAYEYETLGSAIEVPATPTKTSSAEFDYTFAGWIVKGSDGSVKYMTNADLPKVTEEVIYQATYTATTRSYDITFHYDGSDDTKTHVQQVAYGTVPVYDGNEPTKTGTAMVSYVFAGWIDADGTPGLSSVNGAKDYYATFGEEGNTFGITYNLNAGTDASAKIENAVVSYVYGVGTTLPTAANVTRDGYEFSGWYTTATPTMNDTAITAIGTTESGAKVYYAKWTAKKNTLTLNATGGGVFTLYGVNADQGSSYDAVTTHPRLSGLSEMSIGSYEYETDQTVYVRIVVSRSESIDDTEMTAPNALTVKDASGNTVTATYDAATKFYVFTMPATDCTVEATVVNYQVTIDNTVTGGSVGTNYYICAQENDEVDLIVSASNHYTLNGFTFKNDAGEALEITATLQDTNKYVFTMPACNVTVTPVFVPDSYGITFNMNAGSDASAKLVNYDVTSYAYGAGATLPTSAQVTRDGYEFSGWFTTATPTANDTAVTTIGTTESGAKVYYAKWTAKKNTLTLTKAGVGSFSQIAVGSLVEAGELSVDAEMDDPNQSVTYEYETDQTVYVRASVYKGSVGDDITEMTTPNSITIQDVDGNPITPTYADGLYSFTMPAKACTVTVTTVNYQVIISEVANGSVTTDHDNCAEAGDTVKLNIVDVVEGYEFGGFTFKNDADENVTILATKVSDDQYTFTMPAYNVTVEPTFKLKTFSITFVDEDGTTVLKEATTYEYGTQVADIVTPADPTKDDDDDYHYTFNGWTPALAEVTTDQTYKATYLATEIIHVTGVSLDATEIAVIVDDEPFVINATIAPDEAENQEVIWSIPEADADIASVESDGLTALVTGLSNGETTLTVTTVDGGFTATVPVTVTTNVAGVTLTTSSDTAILGKADVILTATISPATASNKNVTWTVENPNILTLADADATANESGVAKATIVPKAVGGTKITVETENGSCTANVTVTVKGYTVTWVNDDENNTVLLTETNVQYGTVPSYRGEAMPTKEKTDQYTYSFKGWKIGTQEYPNDGTTGLPDIKGDTTIQAYYTPVIRQYNVTFVGEDGTSVLKEATAYNYNTLGSAIVEPEAPAKDPTNTIKYTFAGWTVDGTTTYETGSLPNVTGTVTYKAVYTPETRLYSLTFIDKKADGTRTVLDHQDVEYETVTEYKGELPTKASDDTYYYLFDGWMIEGLESQFMINADRLQLSKVTEDITYVVHFTSLNRGLYYAIINDEEGDTPVLHLYEHALGTRRTELVDGKLDSSKYLDDTGNDVSATITKVVIEDEIHPTSMENAFNGCTGLTTITNIENLKTDQVTSMEGAFQDCTSLESLDVSNFDTSNVTTMKNMFSNCSNYELQSLDVSGFDTSSVTDMSGMFQGCMGLTSLDVSGLDTENVTNMDNMFNYCYGLESLDVSSFDTKNVTSMIGMFEYCSALTSLDLSGFDTSNVTNMSFMFDECYMMTSLNLSGWNTSNVTDMHTMFAEMRNIEALDLSSFNTANVTNMNQMFRSAEYARELKAIYVSDAFVIASGASTERMFVNCDNLVGGNGTTYDSSHVDGTYACIDGKNDQPGYFTDKTRRIYYKLTDESGEKVLRFSDAPDTGYQQIMGGMLNSSQYVSTDNTITIGKNDITKVIIEKDIYPSNLNGAFYNCGNLTEIVNIDLLHTENVTSMADMFLYCFKLASIDATGFDTSRVTDMSYMFGYCALLEELDLSSFNTSNVTRMDYMFGDCEALKTIYATDAFDITNVTDTMGEDGDGTMFNNCMELVGGMGTKYYLGNYEYNVGDKSYAHVDGRLGQPGYFTDKNYEASIYYNVDVQGTDTVLHFYATPATGRTQIKSGMLDGEYEGLSGMAYEEVTKVVFEETISPIDMKMAFASFEKLTSFENFDKLDMESVMFANGAFSYLSAYSGVLDLRGLNTSNVRDMSNMFAYSDKLTGIIFGEGFDTSKVENFSATFQGCTGLTSLDLSAWDMGSAKDMQYMFYQCSGLTSLNLDNVNTVNVTSMYNTFAGCEELTSLSLVNFKTDSVTTMESMFQDCKKIEMIDVSGFDTTNVTDFSYMFLDCYKLTSVDVSGFNTANAEYMFAMFQNCNELTAIDVSGFETSKVKSFSMMFFGCEKLESLDLTNFNTANAKGMAQMFFNCVGLTELDLRSFDTSNVEEFYQMFAADSEMALTKIYASDAFVTTNIVDGYGYGMFTNCNNLIGGNGTPYNASNDDFTYAWIDGKDGQLGYFTNKSGVFYTLNSEDNEVVLHLYAQPRAGRTELMDGKMNSSQYVSTTGGAELNREDITKVVIEEAIEPTGVIGAFNECYNLKSIEGMEYLSTAGLTSMEDMFNECDSLETVDLSHFDTSSVTSMFGMFKNCSSLKELDLSSFDTRNVDSMGYMFYNCTKLRTIYVLDNGLFDVSLVEDSYGPYNDEGWDEDGMFSFCQKLMGGAGTRHWFEYGVWNPIDKEYARIDGKDGLPGYFTLKGSVDESSIYFTLVDDVATGEKVLTFYDEDGTDSPRNRVDHGSMFSEEFASGDISHSDVTKIVFEDEIYPSAMAYAFSGMSSVTAIENFENLHTDNVTSLRGVFGGFGYEGDIDLSEWNVSNVVSLADAFNYSRFTSINVSGWTCPKLTNMEGAFESCSNLTSLTIDSFSAPNLTDLSEAFAFCTSLESIDLSGMSTPKLEYMYETFKGNTALKNVNLEGLNTSRVTDVDALFMDCSSLVSIDLSYLDTSSVEDLRSFFEGCSNLETVNLSGWDTANVTGMHSMFRECTKLKEVDLSGFDTSSLTNIGYMFDGCYSLTTVDLSSFDTSKVTMSWYMFYASNGDHNLTTIYASDAFDLSLAGESGYGGYMFNGRAGLIGGEGSTVTSGHEDCTYARVDGGAAAPGYFTDKTKIVSGLYYTLKADGDDVVLKLYGQSGGGRTKLTDNALNSDLYVSSAVGAAAFDKTDITKVIIMEEIKPSNMENAFNGCTSLKTIEGIDLLDTSEVTSMSGAFQNCGLLTEVDLSNFDTSNVTDMSYMFAGMGADEYIEPDQIRAWDLSSFNTSKVTTMEGMFEGCNWTSELNLSSFDTSSVTNMSKMFNNVYRLEELDLTSFDTKKVTDMSYMFNTCYVKTIYASENFDVSIVTEDESMFSGCSELVGGRGTRVSYYMESEHNPTDKTYARFDKVGQPGYFTDKNDTYANIYYTLTRVDDDHVTMRLYASEGDGRMVLPNASLYADNYVSEEDGIDKEDITDVEIVEDITPNNVAYAFSEMYQLQSITGLNHLLTADVTDMRNMFESTGLSGVLDLTYLNTTNVTTMDSMFSGNGGLTGITFGDNFNTSNVESMNSMFSGCSILESINLTNLDTSKVTDMSAMFENCSKLADIEVAQLETDSLTEAHSMFRNCSSLESLNLSGFDTSRLTDMSQMFDGCSKLTSLDLSSFDTSNVTDMDYMFMNCSKLTSLNLAGFDTRNVVSMQYMFYNCLGLEVIDVSSFDTTNVREFHFMFAAEDEDETLKTIYASADFVINELDYSWSDENLFRNRLGLVGGNGTTYDAGYVDAGYAWIDGKDGKHGYFTEKTVLGLVSLTGEVAIGETLTVTVTDSKPSAGTITYAWKRIDKDDNEEYITGATGNTYTATTDDVAHLLACEVSGTSTTLKVTVVTETRVLGDDKTVTFNMNGINGAAADYTPEEQTVAVGGTVAIPGDFPEFIEGNAFAGWYTEAACTTEWNFEKDLVEDDLELFAKWNAPIYWRVDDSSGYPTLYLESSGTNGGEKLLTQKFSNVDLAPWSGTDYEGVEIVDDIYPTYLSYWFSGESSLSYIEGWEHLHTDDVIDMSGLFAGATNLDLSTLDLSNFNTARVRNMSYMFQSAGTEADSWLDSWFIDLTSFNTSNVENMNNMFESAERLRAIYVSDNFVTSKVTAGLYMFSNCYYLTGANGTRYSEIGETNSDYAWIDGKDGKPGYLSRKPETAHAIHMLYLDEYGGSMGEATWTESTDRATPSFYVNNSETSLNQAKQYDRVNIFVSAKPGYKITETPVGSDERRDSITSNNADYQVGGTNVNGEWGVLSLRMPDHDIWVYAKAEPKEEQTAGSITTYYKVWNDTDETFTTTPAGGTVATTKSNGDPVDAVSQGDVINLTITPKEGYRLAKLRAVRWYVDAEVEYEFGTSGGDNITEITYDAEGVGTAQYTISEVMDDNRLILEATFMKDMEYSLQFMQYVDKGRDGYEETEDAATITAKVGDNAVTKVATGDLVELTIAPEVNYRVKEMEAKYVGGWDEKEITLLEDKTKDNVYYFNVESTYFDAETYIDIMAVFTYGYKVTKGANPAGGSFTVAVSGSYEVENVAVGDEVVIQVYTETGMTWDQIIVKDADGNAIELTQPIENVGIFTFVMPASDVTVSVTFKATAENTTVNLTQYQSATKIQQYLNTSGVSEVKLSPSTDNKEYTIDSSLTIPEGKKLTVAEGAVLKVSGSITVMAGATLQNDGELINMGTIEANTSETVTKLINNGTLFNAGNIIFSDPAVVENYGEYVAIEEPSSFDNHNTASTLINTSNEYVGACGLWAGYGVWDNGTSKALKFYGMGDMNNYTISETAPWYGSRQSITTITIPEGITSIGNYAFKSHTAISEIVIPEGVTSIGQYAFDGCSNLATVTLPTTLTFLGGYAFNDCAVSSLSYPGGPTGEGIYLPPKLEYLTERCFYNCPLAATVVVGHNVKQLGYGALGSDTQNETLQEIWLPFIYLDSIYAPFANRSGLKTINYEGGSGDWAMIYISDGAIPDGVSIQYDQSYNY